MNTLHAFAQNNADALQLLPFGSIKPEGWIKNEMQRDFSGFVGKLDVLVPELINDPIYSTGRLHKGSKAKDLGNQKQGDAAGDEQYKWWNSETQSNWWDGYIRHAFLLNHKEAIQKVNAYIERILATQDEDGYIGIYDADLRYNLSSENGELWAKASLYRGLLAYYECTGNKKVWKALVKAVDNVFKNYPIQRSSPFTSGNSFNGGVSHGLTFTDVLERMYFHTQEGKYREYAAFLYEDFSNTYQSESDAQLRNILNSDYKLKSHGVHTYEHLRALLIAGKYTKDETLKKALQIYLSKIHSATTLAGGPIGDEWIAERTADATHTGYEFCSLHEMLDSYGMLLQHAGITEHADRMEHLFFNAALGAKHPTHSCIAYLKTDNSFEMMGTRNGEAEPNRKQTRYKYSPAHQDVAVCCNPNAGRISPYFLQYAWMKENEETLVALLLIPNTVETKLENSTIRISSKTEYPYEYNHQLNIEIPEEKIFTLKIRKPEWAVEIITNEPYSIQNGFIVIRRNWKKQDSVQLEFRAQVEQKKDARENSYFVYGPLVYALPIEAEEIQGKDYGQNLKDYFYKPLSDVKYQITNAPRAEFKMGQIQLQLMNPTNRSIENKVLIPLGKTVLRQVTFEPDK